MFPREGGIAIEQYGNGMRLDLDKFDKFIGEPLIRKHYERMHKDEKQQDNVTALLKAQVEQNKMMQEAVEKLTEQKEQENKKKGFISRLFNR